MFLVINNQPINVSIYEFNDVIMNNWTINEIETKYNTIDMSVQFSKLGTHPICFLFKRI